MPAASISIVTWNSATTIQRCLESILCQTVTDYELFVVDNHSEDETSSIVRQYQDPRLRFIALPENIGYCGGHNTAIRCAQAPHVLLVNPDISMHPDYLEVALRSISKDEHIGTVCGLLVQQELDHPQCRVDSAGLDILRDRRCRLRHHGRQLSDVHLTAQEIFGADGALPLYRRSMIDDVAIRGDLFDERFFAHKEDWDVSWRSTLMGWKTVFEPACIALHPRFFKPGDLRLRKEVGESIKYHAVKNQLLLLLKNEDAGNFVKDLLFIVSRQFAILMYAILFERSSLKAYGYVVRQWRSIMADRALIHARTKVSPAAIRQWTQHGAATAGSYHE